MPKATKGKHHLNFAHECFSDEWLDWDAFRSKDELLQTDIGFIIFRYTNGRSDERVIQQRLVDFFFFLTKRLNCRDAQRLTLNADIQ